MIELLIASLLLGFLGSMHCVGMCGGLVTSLSMSRPHIWWAGLCSYQVGRIIVYTLLGLIAGMIGIALTQIGWFANMQQGIAIFSGLLMVVFGLTLAGWLADPLVRNMAKITDIIGLKKWIYTASTSRMPMSWLMVGLFNGLLPCGLVYAGLALSLTSGNVALSAAMMFAFGLGTVPAMLFVPVVLRSASPKTRGLVLKIAAILLIAMGAFTMVRGSSLMHNMHDMDHMQTMEHSNHMMNHDINNSKHHTMSNMNTQDEDIKDMDMQDMKMELP